LAAGLWECRHREPQLFGKSCRCGILGVKNYYNRFKLNINESLYNQCVEYVGSIIACIFRKIDSVQLGSDRGYQKILFCAPVLTYGRVKRLMDGMTGNMLFLGYFGGLKL